MCDEHKDLFDISFHARSSCTLRLLTQAVGMLRSSPPQLLRGWDAVPAHLLSRPVTKDMKFPSLPLPAGHHHPSCIPPAGCLGSNSAGHTCFDRHTSSPNLSVLPPPPSFIHAAAFAQSWGSFLYGALRNKTSESCLPTGNIKGGNTAQAANIFTASKSFPVSGSLHRDCLTAPGCAQESLAPRVSYLLAGPRPRGSSPSQGRARPPLIACATREMGLCSSHYLLFIDKAVTLDSFLKLIHHVLLSSPVRRQDERRTACGEGGRIYSAASVPGTEPAVGNPSLTFLVEGWLTQPRSITSCRAHLTFPEPDWWENTHPHPSPQNSGDEQTESKE